MWDSPSSDSSIYRTIQFSLAIDRMIVLISLGLNPAEMTVMEIYEKGQDGVAFQPKLTIMDAARVKQVATENSFITD